MKRSRLLVIMAVASLITVSGCGLFKKKCDCPSFGGNGHHHRSTGPGW